jgi:acyl dehydratase
VAQHHFETLPGSAGAYALILAKLARRPSAAVELPTIRATCRDARWPTDRLDAYKRLVRHPHDDRGLPAFVPQLMAAPLHLRLLSDAALPLSPLGLVHVENEIVLREPIHASEPLEIRTWVEGLTPHARGTLLTLRTQARPRSRREQGAAYEATTVTLARRAGPRESRERVSQPPLSQRTTFELPEGLGRAYARVAGDLNPIHQHRVLARPFGFERAVIHGTYTAARAMSELLPSVPEAPYRLRARFHSPVFLPSTVCAGYDADDLVVRDADGVREHVRVTLTAL